jgi:hypothetical protein
LGKWAKQYIHFLPQKLPLGAACLTTDEFADAIAATACIG